MKQTLLIGLGNPGEEYVGTYHNVGSETLNFFKEKLEERYGTVGVKTGKKFYFYVWETEAKQIILVYPTTYMNVSGEAVFEALKWFNGESVETVVFHDDSDLAIGEYKESIGGAAGHHGIESILKSVNNANILRVRIGIRDPLEKSGELPRRKAGDFVLNKIKEKDFKELRIKVFEELAQKFL